MKEEESGKQKTKEEKQRLKTLGIKRSGRDRSEMGTKGGLSRVFPALKGFFGCSIVN